MKSRSIHTHLFQTGKNHTSCSDLRRIVGRHFNMSGDPERIVRIGTIVQSQPVVMRDVPMDRRRVEFASYMVPRLSDADTRDVPTNFKKVEFDGLTTQSSSDAASRGVPSKPLRFVGRVAQR